MRDLLGGLAAIGLGLASFFVIFGWWVLIPTNISFLDVGDRAMHTLGWMFFRNAAWGIPPGASPHLGIELANSIALVDGLPLFAIPLKLIAQWLPTPFQYWGYWWLLCCLLQSVFAYLIAREMGARRRIAVLAAGFALITPAFIFRLTLHMALAGHWVILAGLYLYVRRVPPRFYAWPLLLGIVSAIHAYLLAMVLAVWIAALVQRLWLKRIGWGRAAAEILVGAVVAVIVLWAVGFFYTGSLGSYGFGMYRLNLLWPFISYRDWSQIIPDLPHGKYDYEGISFLGIGIFVLLGLSILSGAVLKLKVLVGARWLPLIVAVVFLALCALSNKIGFLDQDVLTLPMGGPLDTIGGIFRSSGRFIWPLLYIVTIGSVVLLARRFSPGWSLTVIALAFAVQVVDSEPGWHAFAKNVPAAASVWPTTMTSPLWDRAVAAGYTRIRSIPVDVGFGSDFKDPGYFAVSHDMDIDIVYLGRIDDKALDALKAREADALLTGDFEPHTLYLLDDKSALAAAQRATPADLLATVDGHIVFARNGAFLVDGLGIAPHAALAD